ncbi:hypothetical protein [Pilimelia columellifera]|uniref:Uncharacterized protein n=1 Tax=Pilimelia columellifera subsp. columellifera TaxID=706583 RepID=A0ABP6AWQ3_9ACTN
MDEKLLPRGSASGTFKRLDSEYQGGNRVYVRSVADPNETYDTLVDQETGEFRFPNLHVGIYTISASLWPQFAGEQFVPHTPDPAKAQRFTITPDGSVTASDVFAPLRTITAHVNAADGKPAVKESVDIFPSHSGSVGWTYRDTDANGNVTFDALPGLYHFATKPDGIGNFRQYFPSTLVRSKAKTYEVTSDGTTDTPTDTLLPKTTASGRLVTANGEPVQRVYVELVVDG